MSLNKIVTLNFAEEDLLEIYNISPKILFKIVPLTKVSPKEESLSNIDREHISFTKSPKGDYWLIAIEDNNCLLLPKSNLRVNTFNYQTVQSLFECQGYQAEAAKEFTLKKPARVFLFPNQDWILEERGVLEFSIASSSSQLQLQLEQAHQEKIQLQVELDQLHSRLTKFESEREQYLSHLELFKQMQQASDQSMLLLSEKIQKFVNDGFTRLESRINAIEQNLKSDIRPSKSEEIEIPQVSSEFHEKSQIARQDLAPTPEEQHLAKIYNDKDQTLIKHNIKVSPTQGSLEQNRLGIITKLFSTHPKGAYWIICTQENKYFLVPEYKFKLNQYNYQSLERYFACDGNYEEGELKMVKPAIAKPLDPEGQKWKLVAQGVIEFILSAE